MLQETTQEKLIPPFVASENYVTVVLNGRTYTVPTKPEIIQALKDGATLDEWLELLNVSVSNTLSKVFQAVPYLQDGSVLQFNEDGTVINTETGEEYKSEVFDSVKKLRELGIPVDNVIQFFKKLVKNPSENSRQQLYNFVKANEIVINSSGNLVLYKSTKIDGLSAHNGNEPVKVNGQTFIGRIPNIVGSVIEMDRELVDENPKEACSVGLHVANFEYAKDFAERLLLVEVEPQDVVSVPEDYNMAKVRVCRYKILSQVEEKLEIYKFYQKPVFVWFDTDEDGDVWHEDDEDDEDDEEDNDDYYGEYDDDDNDEEYV